MDGGADDVRREVPLRILELRSRPEASPHRPRGRVPAAAQIEDDQPAGLQDDQTRPVERRAEELSSAECEGPDAAAGREDADGPGLAKNGDPARFEGGDGSLAAERPDNCLA